MVSFFPEGEGSHPLHIDGDGGYITNAQMQFYLNRQRSKSQTIENKQDFFKYLESCKKYNYISDCMEEDPTSARLVWTPTKSSLSFIFPINGRIAEHLADLYERGTSDDTDFEDDTDFGDGVSENKW